ncbi:hypothetical protein [Burkholderia sp. Bp8998]|nr:hypothetical protein [Burkholderia sp. Bp8998]
MTMGLPTAILPCAGHSHRYPGSIVTAEHVPARIATARTAWRVARRLPAT